MYMHVKHWCHFNISARTYFWSRDKCLWRRETWSSFSKLSKSTQMPLPSSQTTCSMSFFCLCAVCLRISLWFDAAALNCFNFPRHGITPLPSFLSLSLPLSLCLLSFLACQSRTCQTDHASSCMNFGRTVSPGWGRNSRMSFANFSAQVKFDQHTELLTNSL